MSTEAPSTFEEFQHRVAAYRSGGHIRFLLVLFLWLGGVVMAAIYQDAIFGTDVSISLQSLAGMIAVACVVTWPIFLIQYHFRRRSRVFGLVCRSCNDELMYKNPNWYCHIQENRTCPSCGQDLFPDNENVA